VVLKELQKLCDSVRPVPDNVALEVLRQELRQENIENVFQDLHLVASASLGQVYKGILRTSGETVAVKVQRPGMLRSFSLDLFLLQKWGDSMDIFTSIFTKQAPFHRALFDTFSRGSYCVSLDRVCVRKYFFGRFGLR
jgi:predicted unusual protein kinase regulating ubiquinone biosynthesis (AarF/ABC1/UbiB family)